MVRNHLKKLLNNPKKCKFPQCWRQLFIIKKRIWSKQGPSCWWKQIWSSFVPRWFAMILLTLLHFHIFLYHSTVYLFMSVYIIYMSMPHVFTIQQFSGVHSVFCPKTSRISAGYLWFFVSINYLFLTFLHRHDFDVLLTNLIDVSDIIVRNGRQISAVDLSTGMQDSCLGIGSSLPEDSRSYFSQLPCKIYRFLKKNPSTTARVKWSYISISQWFLSCFINFNCFLILFTIHYLKWGNIGECTQSHETARCQCPFSKKVAYKIISTHNGRNQKSYLKLWVPGYLESGCWSLSMEHRTMKTNMRGFSREHQQSLQCIESECIFTKFEQD